MTSVPYTPSATPHKGNMHIHRCKETYYKNSQTGMYGSDLKRLRFQRLHLEECCTDKLSLLSWHAESLISAPAWMASRSRQFCATYVIRKSNAGELGGSAVAQHNKKKILRMCS
mmetsp:Transcript_1516/g.9341  ORF Transcript_1516/g.9341 Transcript_1516/m.9341 type:complete len:114 (+) Transcript_1516:252-593(+)